jgi:hypothetical protein
MEKVSSETGVNKTMSRKINLMMSKRDVMMPEEAAGGGGGYDAR